MESKSTYAANDLKRIASEKLSEASIDTKNIAIPLRDGTKACNVDSTQESNRRDISQISGNYAVYPEGPLHFIDIDEWGKVPESLLENTKNTFTVSSPSEGGQHRWLLADKPLPNIKREWGEIRSQNWYVVGPGSSIPDYGSYTIENDSPIQEFAKEDIAEWIGGFSKDKKETEGFSEGIDIDSLDGVPDEAQQVLKDLQSEHTAFFQDLQDRLNGGRGSMGNSLSKDSGEIDRSRLDFVTLKDLYGVFREYGYSHSESRGLAGNVYSYYSKENQFTKDGQKRKWEKRGGKYHRDMLDKAIQKFDESIFLKLLNQSNGSRREFNEYSDITYKITDFVIDWLTNDWDIDTAQDMASIGYDLDFDRSKLEAVTEEPMYVDTTPLSKGGQECEYPSPQAVRVICSEIDSRSESTYKKATQKLQRDGALKVAYLGGNDYRVYQSHLADPPEAEHIRYKGEKYEPGENRQTNNNSAKRVCI